MKTMVFWDVMWCGWVAADVSEKPAGSLFEKEYWTPQM
jgi:hypothetical protein